MRVLVVDWLGAEAHQVDDLVRRYVTSKEDPKYFHSADGSDVVSKFAQTRGFELMTSYANSEQVYTTLLKLVTQGFLDIVLVTSEDLQYLDYCEVLSQGMEARITLVRPDGTEKEFDGREEPDPAHLSPSLRVALSEERDQNPVSTKTLNTELAQEYRALEAAINSDKRPATGAFEIDKMVESYNKKVKK